MNNIQIEMGKIITELQKPLTDNYDSDGVELSVGNVYVEIWESCKNISVTSYEDGTQITGDRLQILEYIQRLDVITLDNMISLAENMGL